ncbi:MAG TPA: primosomal protein N', partial [Porphyromonadaceae bacterium]|nr:primosomal protein N' [Porphyromonadaceae bacterium]
MISYYIPYLSGMDGCVDVLLPLPLKNCFSYLVPKEMEEKVRVGKRVLVPFGKRKFYAGIIVNRSVLPLPKEGMKEILEVLDEYPVVTPIQLKFWTWIADYYLCTLGEVCKAALPSVLKLESESIVSFNEEA